MPCILSIETSTKVCSLAISERNNLIYYKEDKAGSSHSSSLGLFAEEGIQLLDKSDLKLDAVAVSEGPGSYTGLRISVSFAKGLCYGYGVPMIAIPSLKIMASRILNSDKYNIKDGTLLCPMIDARRMEVYSAIYDAHLNEVRSVQADVIDESAYQTYLAGNTVLFFGDGSDKCKSAIISPNAIFVDDIYPSASDMVLLAAEAYNKKEFVDVAYFEPFYLKEFQAVVAKNKVINK